MLVVGALPMCPWWEWTGSGVLSVGLEEALTCSLLSGM